MRDDAAPGPLTPASAPKAPGRLDREDARSIGGGTPLVKTVAVVGLGKIGLPLAAQYASKGMTVIGCDVLEDIVETINSGHSHIREEPGLEEAIASAVKQGRLHATVDTTAAVKKAD